MNIACILLVVACTVKPQATSLGPVSVPCLIKNDQIYVRAMFAGNVSALLKLDTGRSVTCISKSLASRLNSNDNQLTHSISLGTMKMRSLKMELCMDSIIDNETSRTNEKVDGLLGTDYFDKMLVGMDMKRQEIYIWEQPYSVLSAVRLWFKDAKGNVAKDTMSINSEKVSCPYSLSLQKSPYIANGYCALMQFKGLMVESLLDTGCSVNFGNLTIVKMINGPKYLYDRPSVFVGRSVNNQVFSIGAISLPGLELVKSVELDVIKDYTYDTCIGFPILSQLRMLWDFGNMKFYYYPNESSPGYVLKAPEDVDRSPYIRSSEGIVTQLKGGWNFIPANYTVRNIKIYKSVDVKDGNRYIYIK